MKLIVRVLEEVQKCPATSQDISDELGISVKTASATLHDLYKDGLIERIGSIKYYKNSRDSFIYEYNNR